VYTIKKSKLLPLLLITLTIASTLIVPLSMPVTEAATETQSSWTKLSNMPTPRGEFGIAVVAGKIYVIGGIDDNNLPLSTVEMYDPLTDVWTSKMSMPTPRSGLAVAVYNNKIYAIGGHINNGYVGNNEVYDTATNTWTPKSSMPTPRADLSANIVNGVIYLIGGKRYSGSAPFYVETNVNECYFPDNDSWSTRASIPTSVEGYASAVVDNKIYVIGGSKYSTTAGIISLVNANQVYDSQTDQWTQAAPLPVTTSYGAAASTTGNLALQGIYFVGGFTGDTYSKKAQMLSLSNNSWVDLESMPTAREYLGLAVVSDELYAIGGFDGSHWLSNNEKYKPIGYGAVPPKIQITSPENRTYREATLDFTLNRGAQWIGYSLDRQANKTVLEPTKLTNLAQGSHSIIMYANDSAGNMGVSNIVYFSIDSVAPTLIIDLPANQTYGSTDIELAFSVDDSAVTLAYSLDGQPEVPVVGNITLIALTNGGHRLTVYATDANGNRAQETVYFNIAPFPFLVVAAALTIAIIVGATGFLFVKRRKTKKESVVNQVSFESKPSKAPMTTSTPPIPPAMMPRIISIIAHAK
jgi:N-acetylneuraminic acid mutarotase